MKNPFQKPQPPTPQPQLPYVSPETRQVIIALINGQQSKITPMPPPKRQGKL